MEKRTDQRDGEAPEEDLVGQLLDLAGRRPPMSEDALAELRRVAYPVWQRKVRAHAGVVDIGERRGRYWPLAAAATVVLAAGLGLFWSRIGPTAGAPPVVARVEALVNGAGLWSGEAAAGPLAVAAEIPAGATLATADDGLLAVRLAAGPSLRLDAGTRLTLESATVVALRQGAVYFDSAPGAAAEVEVHTPFGVVRDVGTQFEARLVGGGLRLQVREGEVRLEREGAEHPALAGAVLTVEAGGTVETGTVPDYGDAWDWMLAVTPAFVLEDRTVGEFLAWVARETGWRLRYADPTLESEVAAAVAHGSIAGLAPDQSLEVVLPTAGLGFRVEAGTLHVARAGVE